MTGASVDRADEVGRLLEPVLASMGYELVAVEWVFEGRRTLRVYIDAPERAQGGVSLDDCAAVTHRVSDLLDVEDPIAGAYVLEVSSPGIDRPLRKLSDFRRFTGERAKIQTFEKLEGRRNFTGVIEGAGEDGTVAIVLEDGQAFRIPLEAIKKARLDVDPFAAKAKDA
jgi:ribosome maturation factor RimP